jgi:hypothetical protein
MTKKKIKPEPLEEYVDLKQEFNQKYKQKKQTQEQARDRRHAIRESKEDKDYWN